MERLRHPPSVTLPVTGTTINLPDGPALAWYSGLGAMAALFVPGLRSRAATRRFEAVPTAS